MKLGIYFFLIVFFVFTNKVKAQSMIEYKDIKIYHCKGETVLECAKKFQDSLLINADLFFVINDSTNSLEDLTYKELEIIADKAKKSDCTLLITSFTWKQENDGVDNVYMMGFKQKK